MTKALLVLAVWSLAVLCAAGEHAGGVRDRELARGEKFYYEYWFRLWQFPVIMAIKLKAMVAIVFFAFFSTIVQAAVYQRNSCQTPTIYKEPSHSWGSLDRG